MPKNKLNKKYWVLQNEQKSHRGLGKYVYMEWLIPIKDYYCSIRKNEVIFEIITPAKGKLMIAFDGLANVLPTAISILIGFTVMLITLLLTSSGDSVEHLKTIETEKFLYNKPITLY